MWVLFFTVLVYSHVWVHSYLLICMLWSRWCAWLSPLWARPPAVRADTPKLFFFFKKRPPQSLLLHEGQLRLTASQLRFISWAFLLRSRDYGLVSRNSQEWSLVRVKHKIMTFLKKRLKWSLPEKDEDEDNNNDDDDELGCDGWPYIPYGTPVWHCLTPPNTQRGCQDRGKGRRRGLMDGGGCVECQLQRLQEWCWSGGKGRQWGCTVFGGRIQPATWGPCSPN